jgi:hypothetical protein
MNERSTGLISLTSEFMRKNAISDQLEVVRFSAALNQ